MGDSCRRVGAAAAFAALLPTSHSTGSRLWLHATAAFAAKNRLFVDLGLSGAAA